MRNMKDTIVVDLDGTLSDCRHRRYLVEGKHRDYDAFHRKLEEDPVNEAVRFIMRGYFNCMWPRLEIVSARPKSYKGATCLWLEKHGIFPDAVNLLRDDGDNTPDQELKRAWLHAYGKDRIHFVIDDRQKVVDMWRAEGVPCLQFANSKED